jgi:hypothetical protein
MTFKENLVMRTVLAIFAAIFLTANASAQQQVSPTAPQEAETTDMPVARATNKPGRELAQHRRVRHAWLRHCESACGFINGWRAFPLHDPLGYFYTGRRPCR